MMRVLVGLSLCLAGCAFDHGAAGPDGTGDDTGSGAPGAPQGDSDGDGVADLVDNCATVANVDQRDHDADGRGDRCDVCPHLPDTGSDADGDSVGDACDPNPTRAGDRIAFFIGFYDPVDWKPVIGGATWQVAGGELRQTSVGDADQLVRDDNPDLRTVFVDARVRINSMSPDVTMRRSVGLVMGYGDPKHYYFCGLAAQGQVGEINAGAVSTNFWGTAQYDYTPGAFAAPMTNDWLTLQATTTAVDGQTRIDCMGNRGVVTGTADYAADGDPSGDIGLRTNGVDASFDYIFVVETAPGNP